MGVPTVLAHDTKLYMPFAFVSVFDFHIICAVLKLSLCLYWSIMTIKNTKYS